MKKWMTLNKKFASKCHIYNRYTLERQSEESLKKGTFDVLESRDWVNVIALTEKKEVIIVEQYRHGIDQIALEIPGGALEVKEDPVVGAKREFEEETGYVSNRWSLLGAVDVNPAFMTNQCFTYLAEDCVYKGDQKLDELEEINIHLIPLEDVYKMILDRKITHSLVIAAFYLYRLR